MNYLNTNFADASATMTEKGALARLKKAHDKRLFVGCRCFTMQRPTDGNYLAVVILSADPQCSYHIPALCDMGICVVN
jgi:hypothetical protein